MKGDYHLAWHQLYVPGMVAGTVPLCYVLVPASTPRALGLFMVEVITDSGRPKERFKVNSLQLVSPRDPELPAAGSEAVYCPREKALIARLLERAGKAGSLLKIVPTSFPPPWSRLSIPEFDRQTLWRAGGAL
jgi:hypothetical protein